MFPFVLVRKAALPWSALEPCRHQEALHLHRRVRAVRETIAVAGEALASRLYRYVPAIEEPVVRHAILSARRAALRSEPLPDGQWRNHLQPDDSVTALLERYTELANQHTALVQARDVAFDRDVGQTTLAIFRLLRTGPVQLGMLMANPRLPALLDQIDETAPLRKRERRALLRGFRYLLRATFNPVPFSFLASTWIIDVKEDANTASTGDLLSHVRLNREMLKGVATAVLAHHAVRESAAVAIPETLHTDGTCCWILESQCKTQYVPVAVPVDVYKRLRYVEREVLSCTCLANAIGVSRATVEEWLDQGILTRTLHVSDAETDDIDVLTRALWQTVTVDFSCLPVIAQLTELANAAVSCESLDPTTRASALAVCEKAARSLPGIRELPRATVFEDAVGAEAVADLPSAWHEFLGEVALYGTSIRCADAKFSTEALAAIHRELFPDQVRTAFLDFHRRYLTFCMARGFTTDPWTNAPEILAWQGKSVINPVDAIVAELEEAHLKGSGKEIVYRPTIRASALEPESPGERMSIRFCTAPSGPFGPRFQLLFWGADQMSLFPRYSQMPGGRAHRLKSAFAEWMAQWPEVVDVYTSLGRNIDMRPVLTSRIVEAPGGSTHRDAIRLRDLVVARDEAERRLVLLDSDGRRLKPIFLGVSSPFHLPEIVRFLTFLAGRGSSVLEMVAQAANRILSSAIAKPPRSPIWLPAILLGDHILISPPAMVFDPRPLLRPGESSYRKVFFAVHDWLAEHGVPPVVWVRTVRGSLPVDFQHPLGVDSFLKFLRHHESAVIHPCHWITGTTGIHGRSTEYYVELASFRRWSN